MDLLCEATNPTWWLLYTWGLRRHPTYQSNKKGPSTRDSDSLIYVLVAVLCSTELMVRDVITALASGSVGWSFVSYTKRLWVLSQSGHILRFQVRFLAGAHRGGNQSMFLSHVDVSLSLSLSLPLPLSLKINKLSLGEIFFKGMSLQNWALL